MHWVPLAGKLRAVLSGQYTALPGCRPVGKWLNGCARQDLDVFIEVHIEQGRILFDERINLGIVQAITGLQHQWVTVKGRADHAGTTTMYQRRDALQGAAQMATEITRLVEREGRPAVVTLGKWEVKPGAVNVIPDEVSFSIDLRHPMLQSRSETLFQT